MTMWFYKPSLATGAKGFTIIELLIALGVLGLVIGIGIQILLSVLGGFLKSNTIASLQEEGSRIIGEMSRTIRDGKKVEDVSGTLCSGTCNGAPCSGIQITLLKDSLEYTSNGNCEKVIFCEVPTDGATYNTFLEKRLPSGNCVGTPTGGGELTNKDPKVGADIANLEFNVTPGVNAPYLVEITLKLRQAILAPSNKTSQAEVELRNSVSTRNY